MICRLARFDPLRLDEVNARVRVRDGLFAYLEIVRGEAMVQYRHDQVLFVQGGMKKAPKPPAILRRKSRKRAPTDAFVEAPKPAFLEKMESRKKAESGGSRR